MAKFIHKYISTMLPVNQCQLYAINESSLKKLIVEGGSTDQVYFSYISYLHTFKKFVYTGEGLDAINLTARHDDIATIRKGPHLFRKRKIRIFSHQYRVSCGEFSKPTKILGDMPRKAIVGTNETRMIHSENSDYFHILEFTSTSKPSAIFLIHTLHKEKFWFFNLHKHPLPDALSSWDRDRLRTHIDKRKLDRVIVPTVVLIYDTDTIDLHESIVLERTRSRCGEEHISLGRLDHRTRLHEAPLTWCKRNLFTTIKIKRTSTCGLILKGEFSSIFDTNLHDREKE